MPDCSESDRVFEQGVALFAKGNSFEAKSLFEALVIENPDNFHALNALGIIAMNSGDLIPAYNFLQRALDINPSFDKANNTMGQILLNLGQIAAAKDYFKRAVTINSDFAEAYANLAHLLLGEGCVDDAVQAFSTAVMLRPDSWSMRAGYAAALENSGDFTASEDEYRRAAELNPASAELCNNIGSCRARAKDYSDAENWYRKGLAINPESAQILNNLGNILTLAGNQSGAEKCFLAAITISGEFILPLIGLSELYAGTGRLHDAERVYRQALSIDESSVPARTGLSDTLRSLLQFPEAEQLILKVLEVDPENITALNVCGLLYADMSRFPESFAVFDRALSVEPGSQKTLANLAGAMISSGKNSEALNLLLSTVSPSTDFPHIWCNIGMAYFNLGHYEKSLSAFDKALLCDPGHRPALINRTNALMNLGRPMEALESIETAESSGENSYGLFLNKGVLLSSLARHKEAIVAYRQALSINPDGFEAYSNILYSLNFSSEFHDQTIQVNREVDLRFGGTVCSDFTNQNLHDEREIRVGYVSPDFRKHSVSYFFLPLLRGHDRNTFKIFCYYSNHVSDSMTAQLKSHADVWRDVCALPDKTLAEMIVTDEIDVLVDLAGHTAGNRLKVFALKPARVQFTWLGYPATTGLSAIDYRLTDYMADPIGLADSIHTEKLIRLNNAFLCYSPPDDAPEVVSAPVSDNGYITFGSFNNPAKIVDETLSIWSEVLYRIPDSRLLLKGKMFIEEKSRLFFLRRLKSFGVASERVILAPHAENVVSHLEMYSNIDISLDTYPYNGTTTTFESLWMGVPVVTLKGDRHAARVGTSILSRLDRNEWIGESVEDFIEKAVRLAGDLEKLDATRIKMRKQLSASSLCDGANFVAEIERQYLKAVHNR
jgi:predicted O-linked N-acetylglucosamine transferase (SPINDLY family)/uncharacterized protein HemY